MAIEAGDVIIPAHVPKSARDSYVENYLAMTKRSRRLMLFAGDQKVKHHRAFAGYSGL